MYPLPNLRLRLFGKAFTSIPFIYSQKRIITEKLIRSPFLKNLFQLLAITWEEDKILFLSYFISSTIGALLLYAVYFVYKIMIDNVAHYTSLTASSNLVIIVITYLFFEYLSRFVNFTFNQYYFDFFIRAKLQNALTRRFMEKLASLDFAHLEDGDVRNLIAKVENTYGFRLPEILHTLNAIVYNVAALVFSLLIAFHFNPVYFFILALVSAPVYYLRAKYGNIAWSSYSTNANNMNYLWYLRSVFTNYQTLSEMKIYGLRSHFLEKTKKIQDKVLSDYQKPIAVYTVLSTASFVLVPVAIYFGISKFMTGIASGIYTLGDFTFFLNALFTFSGQISSILINFGSLSENSLFLNDYFKLMDITNFVTVSTNPHLFSQITPRKIVFENVSFAYPGNSHLSLKNVNLEIERGQDTAIVGHNGAGKSTLIKLLLRFYDPTHGRILVDGVDLRTIEIEQWYKHVGVLFQDFARYFLSLEENIRFGNIENAEQRHVDEALAKSQGQDLLSFMPNGYQQVLGRWFEEGVEISGGQWQKVAIARAIYRAAPILIMDEPTSAIDADAEAEIFKNLKSIYTSKNLLFISHRFSTVRMANKIYVLEKGEVSEAGSHEELLARKGLYHKFFHLQKRGYE